MWDVALKVPLRAFALGRRAEGDGPHHTRVRLLGDPFDRPALASSVAALEDHDDPQALVDNPVLKTDQLYLQTRELLVVASLIELPRFDLVPDKRRTLPFRLDSRHLAHATATERIATLGPRCHASRTATRPPGGETYDAASTERLR